MDDMPDRIRQLDAKVVAQMAVLTAVAFELWPTKAKRREQADFICKWIERVYAEVPVSDHGHVLLQRAIAEVEAMLLGS